MFSGLSIAFMVSADVILMPGEALIKIISVKHQKEYGNVKTCLLYTSEMCIRDRNIIPRCVFMSRPLPKALLFLPEQP